MPSDPVQEFVGLVENLIREVSTVRNLFFRKVMYLVMLDGLSTHRFPDMDMSAGKRFVEFVKEFASWNDCCRVSLPQLDLLLREQHRKEYQDLHARVTERLQQWQDGHVYRVGEVDPLPEDVGDDPILRKCQHSELLWAYRNVLIHEFREPGVTVALGRHDSSPYYCQVDFVDGPLAGSVGWELVIEPVFLEKLVRSAMKNLAAYFHEEAIDPNHIGYRGRAWVAQLRRSVRNNNKNLN